MCIRDSLCDACAAHVAPRARGTARGRGYLLLHGGCATAVAQVMTDARGRRPLSDAYQALGMEGV
eukprot:10101788-Alexandrium_andersonii.AAC.1